MGLLAGIEKQSGFSKAKSGKQCWTVDCTVVKGDQWLVVGFQRIPVSLGEGAMPGYKGHLGGSMIAGGGAIVIALLAGYHFNVDPLRVVGLTAACVLGGLFPDVDTDSKGQNIFYGLLVAVDGVLIYRHHYQWAAWLGFCAMLPALGHHRGWTHTWWAMLLVGAPLVLIPAVVLGVDRFYAFLPFYVSFTVGYFSHLLLDRKFM